MSSNICGNCANFKPNRGEKFFNCTQAVQSGVKYGMQVRPDTRACDGFTSPSIPVAPKQAPKAAPGTAKAPAKTRPTRQGLCPWGRLILIIAIIIAILVLSLLAYTCAKGLISSSEPTSTPTPVPTGVTPTITPVPAYIYLHFAIEEWALSPDRVVLVHSPKKSKVMGTDGAPTGTSFIWFYITVTNTGKSTFSVSPGSFWLTDSQGYTYSPLGTPYYYPWRYNPPTVYPGKTEDGVIPYLVPDFSTGLEVNYTLNPSTVPKTIAKWQLPW